MAILIALMAFLAIGGGLSSLHIAFNNATWADVQAPFTNGCIAAVLFGGFTFFANCRG